MTRYWKEDPNGDVWVGPAIRTCFRATLLPAHSVVVSAEDLRVAMELVDARAVTNPMEGHSLNRLRAALPKQDMLESEEFNNMLEMASRVMHPADRRDLVGKFIRAHFTPKGGK